MVGEDELSSKIAYKGRAITADDIAKDAYLVKNGNEKITNFDVSLDKNDAKKVGDKVKVSFKVGGKDVVTKEVEIIPIDLNKAKITAQIEKLETQKPKTITKGKDVAINDLRQRVQDFLVQAKDPHTDQAILNQALRGFISKIVYNKPENTVDLFFYV